MTPICWTRCSNLRRQNHENCFKSAIAGLDESAAGRSGDRTDRSQHKIVLEKVLPHDPNLSLPRCTAGKRACPPEDCGGVWGYADFLEIIGDPNHPEHEETLDWVGGEFDPEHFDIAEVNRRFE